MHCITRNDRVSPWDIFFVLNMLPPENEVFLLSVPVIDDPAVTVDVAGMEIIQHEWAYISMHFKMNREGELRQYFG